MNRHCDDGGDDEVEVEHYYYNLDHLVDDNLLVDESSKFEFGM